MKEKLKAFLRRLIGRPGGVGASGSKVTALVFAIVNLGQQFGLFSLSPGQVEAINTLLLALLAIFIRDAITTPPADDPPADSPKEETPVKKTLIALFALALVAGAASAQTQRTIHIGTYAELPACSASTLDTLRVVTDADYDYAFGNGAGSYRVLAFCNGSAWSVVTPGAAATNFSASGDVAVGGKLTLGSVVFPESVTFTATAGGANVSEVAITVKDGAGATIAAVHKLTVWLSDATSCAGLTSTTASGTVAAKSASGTDLEVMTAKKAIEVLTLATGIYTLEITDSAKTGFIVCAAINGKSFASASLTAGQYGS